MKKLNNSLFIGIALIIIYTFFNNPNAISSFLGRGFSVFSVFIYGGLIAFLLNPVLKFLEKNKKLKRKYSIIILYATLIAFFCLVFYFIIPRLVRNISDLIDNYPKYIKVLETFIKEYQYLFPNIEEINILDELSVLQQKSLLFIQQEFSFLLGQFLGITIKVFSLFLSIVFSIFFLSNKEYFSSLTTDVLEQLLPKSKVSKVINFSGKVEKVFLGYLSGKTLDSLIIGGISIVGLTILKVPYVILLGMFITIFNFVPYVGPFFGIVVSFTIALFTIPSNAVFVLIFLILLQQFDAWYLEPRILGNSLNLSMFWTIAAIIFGGNLFGAIGIVIAIPSFSLIKELYLIRVEGIKKEKVLEEE